MTLFEIAGGFIAGFIAGVGTILLYLKWKIGRQIGAMQSEMEDIMDMTSEFQDMDLDEPEELDIDTEDEE